MKIKILCHCGSKYEFEVEPVSGQMPHTVQCPVCGADGTEGANFSIQQQLRNSASTIPVPAVTQVTQAQPNVLKVSGHGSVSEPVSTAASVENLEDFCPRHAGNIAAAKCVVCGKNICVACMEQFGHLCSVFCKNQAQSHGIKVPVFRGQKTVRSHDQWKKKSGC